MWCQPKIFAVFFWYDGDGASFARASGTFDGDVARVARGAGAGDCGLSPDLKSEGNSALLNDPARPPILLGGST